MYDTDRFFKEKYINTGTNVNLIYTAYFFKFAV